jgi:hypothetical protein
VIEAVKSLPSRAVIARARESPAAFGTGRLITSICAADTGGIAGGNVPDWPEDSLFLPRCRHGRGLIFRRELAKGEIAE